MTSKSCQNLNQFLANSSLIWTSTQIANSSSFSKVSISSTMESSNSPQQHYSLDPHWTGFHNTLPVTFILENEICTETSWFLIHWKWKWIGSGLGLFSNASPTKHLQQNIANLHLVLIFQQNLSSTKKHTFWSEQNACVILLSLQTEQACM